MLLKNKTKYYIFVSIIYLLIFQNYIQSFLPIFKYWDEFLAIILIPIIIFSKHARKKFLTMNKYNCIIFICYFLIVILGLMSNIYYGYQEYSYIITDVILLLKFPMVYCLSNILFDRNFINANRKKIELHVELIIIFFAILSILNYAVDLFPGGIRYGVKSNQLFYGHPTYLAAICIFLYAILIFSTKKVFSVFSFLLILILMTTLRIKAIGIVLIIVLFCLYISKFNRKVSFIKLFVIFLALTSIFYKQISFYFLESETARQKLLTESVNIANDYFPLGTGFATYGSYYSTQNYSPVYVLYDLDNVYGITKKFHPFISDCFWPMIIGQYGYFGFVLYVIIIICLFMIIQKSFSIERKYFYISKIICILYLLISSTSESAFVNPLAIPLAIIIAL